MFKHVLLATDGSELSDRAVENGVALARALGARITVLTSSRPYHVVAADPVMVTDTKESYLADAEAAARQVLKRVEDIARVAEVRCETIHVFNEHPYRAIIDAAQARDCDAILMASHGRRGVSALLLGSETQKVLTHCKIPVVVWR
jgi:nucleotide-binding universal stress UspA family protein